MSRRPRPSKAASFPWHVLGRSVLRIADLDGGEVDGRTVSGLDQTVAYVRDRFAARGLRLADDAPSVIYIALSTLAVLREAADNARSNEVLTVDAFAELLAVIRTLELAVAEYAPEEARP